MIIIIYMKTKQTIKQSIPSLRRCVSNQFIFMQVIPEFTSEPYFVRKQLDEPKITRGSSLNSRKNKLLDPKKTQSSKQKPHPQIKNKQQVFDKYKLEMMDNKNALKKINSPRNTKPILKQTFSELQTNSTAHKFIENMSQQNFSDQKVSSSCKSVKFSNKLDDQKSVDKREGSRTPSILKNKSKKFGGTASILSGLKSQRSFSINHSFHSNQREIKKKAIEELNGNAIIKKKYEAIIKNLQAKQKKYRPPLPKRKNIENNIEKQKFRDEIFPPVYSSLFPFNPKVEEKKGKQIQWMRISELLPHQKLIVFDKPQAVPKYFDINKEESKVKKITISKQKNSYASQYIVTAFNGIKNNVELLSKIFENHQVNDFGVYLIKIFQENTWKYIIVDDYIPVVKSNMVNTSNPYVPAFINIKPQSMKDSKKIKGFLDSQQLLPIWPFLLEKAFANYYSSYESLTYGNTIDIVQQFCGISYEKVSLVQKTDAEQYLQVIDKLLLVLKNGNVTMLGQLKQTLPMIPMHYKAEYCYSMITEQQLFYYDPNDDYKPVRIKFYDLGLICTALYLYSPSKYLQEAICTISKPKHKISAKLAMKIVSEQNVIHRQYPSVRKFTLHSTSQCLLFVRQKDNRFFYRIGIKYIWLRVMLIGVEYDGTYRWIDGEYTQNKIVSFNHLLDAGQYLLLIWPQWSKQKYNHQIFVSVFSNQAIETIERGVFRPKQKIIQNACMDLAQKNGKLKQINKFICSYSYIDKKCALIIENIVNERLHGEVNIVRSIVGLKSSVQIVPINDEFFQQIKQIEKEEGIQYLALKKTSIDVKIPKAESFTVVLKMKGGIDYKFFKAFTFGS